MGNLELIKGEGKELHNINVHPGEILLEEFLEPLQISAYVLAKETDIPESSISKIINKKLGISADISLKLGKFFRLPDKFFIGLQTDFELLEAKFKNQEKINKIKPYNELKFG